MSKHAYHAETKAKIVAMKQSINPATNRLWTYRQIGEVLGFTGQAAHYYVGKIEGICPECLQTINQPKP
jgi:hypothetical protein